MPRDRRAASGRTPMSWFSLSLVLTERPKHTARNRMQARRGEQGCTAPYLRTNVPLHFHHKCPCANCVRRLLVIFRSGGLLQCDNTEKESLLAQAPGNAYMFQKDRKKRPHLCLYPRKSARPPSALDKRVRDSCRKVLDDSAICGIVASVPMM